MAEQVPSIPPASVAPVPGPIMWAKDNKLDNGDLIMAGRDVIVYEGWKHLRRELVDLSVKRTFVAPPEYDSIGIRLGVSDLTSRSYAVLVLMANEGFGRRLMAMEAIEKRLGRGASCWSLLPDWDQPSVERIPCERDTGYILDLSGETQPLSSKFLEDLSAYATKAIAVNATLVILAIPAIWPIRVERPGIHTFHLSHPAALAVAQAHLRDSGHEDLESKLNTEFADLLKDRSLPADAVRLAAILARSRDLANNDAVKEAIDEFRNWEQTLKGWFKDHVEIRQRARLISVAVLDGCPDTAVLDAADALLSKLGVPDEGPGGPLAGPDIEDDIDELGAIHAANGIVSLTAKRHDYDLAALNWTWRQRPQLPSILMEWLGEITAPKKCAAEYLERVGEVLARLADTQDVTDIFTIIEGWINSGQQDHMDLAARTLENMTRSPRNWPDVRNKLYNWAGRKSPQFPQLVASICGGELGQELPHIALTRLKIILNYNSEDAEAVHSAAARALSSLADNTKTRSPILDEVVKWLNGDDDRLVGVRGFLGLIDLKAAVAGANSEGSRALSPQERLLLTSKADTGNVSHLLSQGWILILKHGDENSEIRRVLRTWLTAMRDQSEISHVVSAVLVPVLKERTMAKEYLYTIMDEIHHLPEARRLEITDALFHGPGSQPASQTITYPPVSER